jgi:hypothetical protein
MMQLTTKTLLQNKYNYLQTILESNQEVKNTMKWRLINEGAVFYVYLCKQKLKLEK